jgi:hypothetical protein
MKLFWKGFAILALVGLAGCGGQKGPGPVGGDDTPVTVGDGGSIIITFAEAACGDVIRLGDHILEHPKDKKIGKIITNKGMSPGSSHDCGNRCVVEFNFDDNNSVVLTDKKGKEGMLIFTSVPISDYTFSQQGNACVFSYGSLGKPQVKSAGIFGGDKLCDKGGCEISSHYEQ